MPNRRDPALCDQHVFEAVPTGVEEHKRLRAAKVLGDDLPERELAVKPYRDRLIAVKPTRVPVARSKIVR